MTLLVAMLLCVDGGGAYALGSDYEWPGASTSALLISNDFGGQCLTDGGVPIGAQTLRNYDGGVIVDAKGLYFIRGKSGTPNVWANIHTWALGWADTAYGGRYEVCFTPSFSSSQWHDGSNPNWDGTVYLMDVNQVTQHVVTVIYGANSQGNMYVRLNGTAETTFDIPNITLVAGQTYCASVEWVPVTDGGSLCNAWVRHDSCEQTPTPLCTASTVVGAITNGTSACPTYSPSYITLAQRQYGYDSTDLAPTTVHVSALRAYSK